MVNEEAEQVMRACMRGSLDGTMPFPEVVARLVEIGCEQYHADLRRQEKTYYMPGGESHVEPLPLGSQAIAQSFSADSVVAALRAIQERQIDYVEFLGQIIAAGCVGYFVYIAGKRAIYLGRNGEFHVEHFPAPAAVASN
ncbi:MAG TPA: DUF1398 domain-containing protein [Ferrovibrio sp.]|uniref:DUF1398 domain-containing protein n=1 Tax=Ferrovibrio sp. TaxID=1917215 RepID=UPI002ED457CD